MNSTEPTMPGRRTRGARAAKVVVAAVALDEFQMKPGHRPFAFGGRLRLQFRDLLVPLARVGGIRRTATGPAAPLP